MIIKLNDIMKIKYWIYMYIYVYIYYNMCILYTYDTLYIYI